MMNERRQAADSSPSLASPAMKGPKSEGSGASLAAGAKAATVGRLIGERAFHFGASTSAGAIASRDARDRHAIRAGRRFRRRPCGPIRSQRRTRPDRRLFAGRALPAKASADAVPPIATAASPTAVAARSGAPPTHRASATRAAAHEAAHSGQKPDVSAPPPVARVATSAAVHAPAESSGKAADGRPPDPTTSAAPPTAQTDRSARSCRRLSPQGRRSNSTARPPAPDTQTSRPARARSPLAPRPRLRRSARSTSIFRPEASRMSR